MSAFTRFLLLLFVILLLGGAIFLITWDIPPPTQRIEKVLDDSRFPE
ncbi:MAG: hypothetical protein ACFB3T_01575 [Geminicoccaceae bacterium]